MKKILILLCLLAPVVALGQYGMSGYGHGGGAFQVVSDTTSVSKSIGKMYFYTVDNTIYVGNGTYLSQRADFYRLGVTSSLEIDGTVTGDLTVDGKVVARDSMTIGKATVTDNVVPYLRLKGDADSDASAVTSETGSLTLVGDATPANAYWLFNDTQANEFRFFGSTCKLYPSQITCTNFIGTTYGGAAASQFYSAGSALIACDQDNNATNTYIDFGTNGASGTETVLMRIDDDGQVGIGTTAPLTNSLTLGTKGTQRDVIWTRENVPAATDSSGRAYILAGNSRITQRSGDADSTWWTVDNDSTRLASNNPISIYGTTYFWNGISVQSIADRTDYVSQQVAKDILKKLDFSNFEGIKNISDSLILPVELRSKDGRDLTRTVSFLLAVVVEQNKRIDAASRRSFLALGIAVIAIAVSFIRRRR